MRQAQRNACAAGWLLLSCAAWAAQAQERVFELDPAETKVEFSLGATLHTVHGSFRLKRGSVRIDPSSGKMSGELVVDAASGQSGNTSRDREMHKKVLQSDRYPEIVFRPDHVTGSVAAEGASQVQVHGVFSIHGTEHELTVPIAIESAESRYVAVAKFTVPYIKWGMKSPGNFLLRVSDKVEISVRAVARTSTEP
jgi:polyisoprenoid-binding protein YceI